MKQARMARIRLPSRDEIRPDTPLRLSVAAVLVFPDGSMTASGLRRERARGRLVVERIAGKDYTTLANIERMRELCRVQIKGLDCGSDGTAAAQQSGVILNSANEISTGGGEGDGRMARQLDRTES